MKTLLLSALLFFCFHAEALKLPDDAEIQNRLAAHLGNKGDFQDRVFRRLGDRTLEYEGFISTEADMALLKTIFNEPQHYSRWVMKNINHRPSGGDYFIKLRSFDLAPNSRDMVIASLGFELPLFKKTIDCYMTIKTESKGKNFRLTATVDPHRKGTYIEYFETVMQFFPRENGRVWIYAIGNVKFTNWLLYEALPDRMLTRETGERLQIVIDNYLGEENYRRALKIQAKKQ